MFLFITTSDNFSAPHKRPLHPRRRGKDGRHPSRGYLHPHGQREALMPSGLALCQLFRLLDWGGRQRSSMRLVVRCGVFTLYHARTSKTVSAVSERGNMDTGHRLPAWLRPGTKWPPGKNRLPLPHLVLGRLGEATSFPATVSTLWFRQHGPACQRARVPIRATSAEAPAAQPVCAHLSACGRAYPPGSRADFTPRLFGPLSGAFDCAWQVSIPHTQ